MNRLAGTLVTIALMGPPSPAAANPGEAVEGKRLSRKLDLLVNLLGDGFSAEYLPARRAKMVVVNGAGSPASRYSIVFFAIEGFRGGNGHTEYLAVFSWPGGVRSQPQLVDVIAAGSKGVRSLQFDQASIQATGERGIVIEAPTLTYGPSDAACCPSARSSAHFVWSRVSGGRLTETTGGP